MSARVDLATATRTMTLLSANPAPEQVSLYSPGGTSLNSYSPSERLTVVRSAPVSVLWRVSFAPGMTDAEGSSTRPVIFPLKLCASIVVANKRTKAILARLNILFSFVANSVVSLLLGCLCDLRSQVPRHALKPGLGPAAGRESWE